MLETACVDIDELSERDRLEQELKYARRNKMRYIDQLLNELELLNLADRSKTPPIIVQAVDQLAVETDNGKLLKEKNLARILDAMDVLYEVQDSLMFTQIEDE